MRMSSESFFQQSDSKQVQDLLVMLYQHGRGRWASMRTILIGLGVVNHNANNQKKIRSMLEMSNLIEQTGEGKHMWRLNVDAWEAIHEKANHNSKPEEIQQPIPQPAEEKSSVLTPHHWTPANVKTYGIRKLLAKAGAVFVKDMRGNKYWSLPTAHAIRTASSYGLEIHKPTIELENEEASSEQKQEQAFRKNAELYEKHIHTLKSTFPSTEPTPEPIQVPPPAPAIPLQEKIFKRMCDLAKMRLPILLVGPAGSGKSHLAEKLAKTMKLNFASISCTAGMSESHLLGKSIPNIKQGDTRYQASTFVEHYENGGVFLLDELDAADPNILLTINTALANGYLTIPNRPECPRANKHKDFVVVATANTYGKGANRIYSGRNQLDESTLDRFRIGTMELDYDTVLEHKLCPHTELLSKIHAIRQVVADNSMRRIVSTRFIHNASTMKEAGWSDTDILEALVSGWTTDELSRVSHHLKGF